MIREALHLLAAANRRIGVSKCVPRALRQWLRASVMKRLVASAPDRVYLEQHILPCLAQQPWTKLLFIGCESYTQDYGRHFNERSIEYWTVDIKAESATWGEPGRHVTCDVCRLTEHFSREEFDAVLFNGVLGYGINDRDQVDQAVTAIHGVLKPWGVVLVGWNSDLSTDPRDNDRFRALFEQGSSLPLPPRKTFENCTHVFDLFMAKAGHGNSFAE